MSVKAIYAVSGIAVAVLLSGCCCSRMQEKITSLEAGQQKQEAQLNELQKQVQANAAQLKAQAIPADAIGSNAKLIEAALYLINNGNSNVAQQSVYLLGQIGGSEVESVLIKLLDEKPNLSNSIYQALANMQSKKLRPLILKKLDSIDSGNISPEEIGNIINFFNNQSMGGLTRTDLPRLEKLLQAIPDNDYNNNRYWRQSLIGQILRLDSARGIQLLCDEIATATPPYRQRDLLYQINNYNVQIKQSDWGKLIEALGPLSANNAESYSGLFNAMQRSSDWRLTDVVLPWAETVKTNRDAANNYLSMLLNLRDPKAAKVVLEMLNDKELRSYNRGRVEYPGIKQVNGEYTLVSEAELEKLIASRDKLIERLNARDKKRAESGK